jgi:hypothetical protein
MRVLVIGFPLPDPQIDNYNFLSAPSFFDYDALVVDTFAVSRTIEEVVNQSQERLTYADEPVVNGPTSPVAVGLADALRCRQEETQRLLARGHLVVCFAYPDVPHPQVTGFPGCHRYYWLPAPAGLTYAPPYLMPGEGTDVLSTEAGHPFAPYIDQFRTNLLYRAYFAAGALGPGAHVFARSAGGAAVGVEMAVGNGRVVFLPPVRSPGAGTERYPIAERILDGIRRSLTMAAAGPPPPWAGRYALPGLTERETRRQEAERELSAAEARLAEARADTEALERYRRLLWQEGKHGLETIVRDALRLLGFQVTEDLDRPAEAAWGEHTLLLEVEGSSEAVDMAPHYRLRRRLEEALERTARPQRGLIVVNGYRLRPPEERPAQYVDALRVAAESMRYGLVTSFQIFQAVERALEKDEAAVAAFREQLISAEGAVEEQQEGMEHSGNGQTGRRADGLGRGAPSVGSPSS